MVVVVILNFSGINATASHTYNTNTVVKFTKKISCWKTANTMANVVGEATWPQCHTLQFSVGLLDSNTQKG